MLRSLLIVLALSILANASDMNPYMPRKVKLSKEMLAKFAEIPETLSQGKVRQSPFKWRFGSRRGRKTENVAKMNEYEDIIYQSGDVSVFQHGPPSYQQRMHAAEQTQNFIVHSHSGNENEHISATVLTREKRALRPNANQRRTNRMNRIHKQIKTNMVGF